MKRTNLPVIITCFARFPLTPALSLGERGNYPPTHFQAMATVYQSFQTERKPQLTHD